MQLGKALVGALIGAAVGIGLLIVVFMMFGIDKVWLSIPVAILTGLGVRMLVSTSGHPSYARGGLTVLLALGAYIFGWQLVAQVATARANAVETPKFATEAPEVPKGEGEKGEATEETEPDGEAKAPEAAPPPKTQPAAAAKRPAPAAMRQAGPREFSTWDFLWLCVAALVAYELGRGTGGVVAPSSMPPAEPMPAGTHPDA